MAVATTAACRHGRDCSQPDCHFFHPKGRALDDKADDSCRFGVDCKRHDCKYFHPHGRKIDGIPESRFLISTCSSWLSFRPVMPTETQGVIQGVIKELLSIDVQKEDFIPPSSDITILWINTRSNEKASEAFVKLLDSEWSGRMFRKDLTPPSYPGQGPQVKECSDNLQSVLERWRSVFAPMTENQLLAIRRFFDLPQLGPVSWESVLQGLYDLGRFNGIGDKENLRQITEVTSSSDSPSFPTPTLKEPLLPVLTRKLHETPPAPTSEYDGSVPISVITKRMRRVGTETCVFVDGDNFPEAARILLELFPLPQPPAINFGFIVIAFVGVQANFKSFPIAAQLPCFLYMRALTNAKDAADHDLSLLAGSANSTLPLTCPLYICSRDGFARECTSMLKQMEPERDIQLISKDMYRNLITNMQFKALGRSTKGRYQFDGISDSKLPVALGAPSMTVVMNPVIDLPSCSASTPTIQGQDEDIGPVSGEKEPYPSPPRAPRQVSQRPGAEYPCRICRRPGGLPDSHWYWNCPFKSQKSSQRFVIGDDLDTDVIMNSENGRFYKFVAILQEYIVDGTSIVRMSNLGMVLRDRYVYSEKTGLKPLVERAVEENLVVRQGDQGFAEIIILAGNVEAYIARITR